jgi:hypothetical protein
VTPLNLSRLIELSTKKATVPETTQPPPLLLALAFTAHAARESVSLPFVGKFPHLTSARTDPEIYIVPLEDDAVMEYLPPPAASGGECHYFCGDPQMWDFDGDGRRNSNDEDDDGDGVADHQDAYPYWPQASQCECQQLKFVGFTGKFSMAVKDAVLRAFEEVRQPPENLPRVRLDLAAGETPAVSLLFSDSEPCPASSADCDKPLHAPSYYVSRDPDECARIRFRCPSSLVPFSNGCGCGCETG